jgi:predicted NUDIX family NTP pyrophosphohydrolase
MPKPVSAGLMLYRRGDNGIEVFLVHPGGPYYKNKDGGSWSIPKGETMEGEALLENAKREFTEETGKKPEGVFLSLGTTRLKSGKTIHAWAFEGNFEGGIKSNLFELEWPPRSGRVQKFPEADEGRFFTLDEAKRKIHPAQAVFIDRLTAELARKG